MPNIVVFVLLTISNISASGAKYYLHGTDPDDPEAGSGYPGDWIGNPCDELGLVGAVTKPELENLLNGLTLNGDPLALSFQREGRRSGWDLTFNADKSLSVLWAVSSAEQRRAIERVFVGVVDEVFTVIQDGFAFSRRGAGGKESVRADLIGAKFMQFTSRAGEPHLHLHLVIPNAGRLSDGKWGSVDCSKFYHAKMALGALARVELASRLENELGVPIRRNHRGIFRVPGIPESLIEQFSSRRGQVVQHLKESGGEGARDAARSATLTRSAKPKGKLSEVEKTWGITPTMKERVLGAVQKAYARAPRTMDLRTKGSAAKRCSKLGARLLLRRQGAFTRPQLIRATAELCMDGRSDAASVLEAVDKALSSKEFLRGTGQRGELLYGDKKLRKIEERALKRINESQADSGLALSEKRFNASLLRDDVSRLNQEQTKAYAHAVANPGSIHCISGFVGAGKEDVLEAARISWEKAGYRVDGCSPRGLDLGLEQTAGIKSQPIANLIDDLERTVPIGYLQQRVIVVDEANMIGTRDLACLLRLAGRFRSRVILLGDDSQLQAPDAGGLFTAAKKRIGAVEVKENHRQVEHWMVDAIQQVREGDLTGALTQFALAERLCIEETRPEAQDALIEAWASSYEEQPLIIASTQREVSDMNRLAQTYRFEQGDVGHRVSKAHGQEFRYGDRVIFNQTDKELGIREGQLGLVRSCRNAPFGSAISMAIDTDGRKVRIPIKDGPAFDLAYCLTPKKAKGFMTKETFVMVNENGMSKEQLYVAISRSEGATRIFAAQDSLEPPVEHLVKSLSWSEKNLTLHDRMNDEEVERKAAREHELRTEQIRAEEENKQEQHFGRSL